LSRSGHGVRVIVDLQMDMNEYTVFSNLFLGKISAKFFNFRIL